MIARRPYARTGLNALKARVKLGGLAAIDMRTAAARQMVAFRDDLVAALGGEDGLSPQRRKLVEMAARVALFLDHIDAWLSEQRSLVNHRNRSVLPALVQRQPLAGHLARLLDRLGLDRVPQKVVSLEEYMASKYSGDAPDGPRSRQAPAGKRWACSNRCRAELSRRRQVHARAAWLHGWAVRTYAALGIV